MDANQLKEQLLRAEGYAEGFRAGYTAAINYVAAQLSAKEKSEIKLDQGGIAQPEGKSN